MDMSLMTSRCPIRKVKAFQVRDHKRSRDKPRKCFIETLQNNISKLGLPKLLAFIRAMWKGMVHSTSPKYLGQKACCYCCCCCNLLQLLRFTKYLL